MVRHDLPLGILAAHVAHAAGSFRQHPPGTHVVVLSVPDETHLLAVANQLTIAGIAHVVGDENEGEFAGHRMAIGLDLVSDRGPARKVLGGLPLLR